MTDDKKCEYCDKVGVPIIPVRYAIAAAGSGAPKTSAPGVALPESAAFYTRRLLRAGYVYVYDEARKRWEDYFATADGRFAKLAETNGAPQPLPKPFNCPDVKHAQLASCITIRDAKRATNVWIGFSDVQWTANVRKNHEDPAYRKRHMRCVTVNAFQSSPDARHCGGIHEIGNTVAEYAVDPATQAEPPWMDMARQNGAGKHNAPWFMWSPYQFNARKSQTQLLINTAENLARGKGFIVALNDPVSILQELSCFAKLRLQQFIYDNKADKDRHRKLNVSSNIARLEAAVRNQAELDTIDAANDLYNQTLGQSGAALLVPGYADKLASLKDVTPAQLDKASDDAWKKYAEKLTRQGKDREDWQKSYNDALNTFTQETLDLIAKAHVHWMQSESMRAGMQANFDKDHAPHNAAFTALMVQAVRGTAGMKQCFDLYVKLLSADTATDADNLLMRALVFNVDGVAEAAKNATQVNMRVVPWDNVYGPYKTIVEKIGKGHADEAAKLMYELAGPIAKVLNGVVDGPAKLIIGIMSLHAGKPWARVAFTGSRKQFRAELLRQVMAASGEKLDPRDVNRAIAKELKRLEIRGEKLEGKRGAKWLALLDEERIKGMPKADAGKQLAWLEGALTSPEKISELRLNNWRSVINAEARMGVVSGILQAVCFTKLVEDEENSLATDKAESRWRLTAGALAIIGSVAEVTGKVIEGLPKFAAAEAAGATWAIAPRMLNLASRALGGIGGAIMAIWDFMKGQEAIEKGQIGVGWLYRASGVLGLVVTAGFLFSWNPLLMVMLVAAFVLVAWLLEKFKDNKIQTWLEQCIFGTGKHYYSFEDEMKEYELAIK